MEEVKNWLIVNCLTLNAEKNSLHDILQRNIPGNTQITLGQFTLERNSQGKFLCITPDEKHTYKEYISNITKKIARLFGLLYKLRLITH